MVCPLVPGERTEILGHFYGFPFDSMKNRARRDSDARLRKTQGTQTINLERRNFRERKLVFSFFGCRHTKRYRMSLLLSLTPNRFSGQFIVLPEPRRFASGEKCLTAV